MARRDLSGREEGIAGASVPVVINHGGTASTSRPNVGVVPCVIWIGTVIPTNAVDGDVFFNVS